MRSPVCLLLATAVAAVAAESSLTIYNQDFAVVRATVPLELREGVTEVRYNGTTAHLEPSSVMLRDPSGKVPFQVMEQSFRADPVTQGLMLSLFEGQTIDFRVEEDRKFVIVPGKILRSGYDRSRSDNDNLQPIVEVDGKLRFELPGVPQFPSLATDTILKPELHWRISSAQAARVDAQLAYITKKLSWKADYNVLADESSDVLSVVGWVTIENKSGKRFENTQTKLVAGDINKIEPKEEVPAEASTERAIVTGSYIPVTEMAFDEYHLYSLPAPITLRDQETKQVEFLRAENVQSARVYIYNSQGTRDEDFGRGPQDPQLDAGPDGQWEKRVAVVREFKNSEANRLGMPLPKGRWRFYRSARDGQLEFTGENETEHTPKDEMLRIFTGYSFDLAGEKRRVDYVSDLQKRTAEESFEIKLRNHKKEPVEVRVIENLWRWTTWEIAQKSDPFTKKGAQAIEFRVALNPDQEKVLTYKVRYTQLRPPKAEPAPAR